MESAGGQCLCGLVRLELQRHLQVRGSDQGCPSAMWWEWECYLERNLLNWRIFKLHAIERSGHIISIFNSCFSGPDILTISWNIKILEMVADSERISRAWDDCTIKCTSMTDSRSLLFFFPSVRFLLLLVVSLGSVSMYVGGLFCFGPGEDPWKLYL
jgi:hypothetical protein